MSMASTRVGSTTASASPSTSGSTTASASASTSGSTVASASASTSGSTTSSASASTSGSTTASASASTSVRCDRLRLGVGIGRHVDVRLGFVIRSSTARKSSVSCSPVMSSSSSSSSTVVPSSPSTTPSPARAAASSPATTSDATSAVPSPGVSSSARSTSSDPSTARGAPDGAGRSAVAPTEGASEARSSKPIVWGPRSKSASVAGGALDGSSGSAPPGRISSRWRRCHTGSARRHFRWPIRSSGARTSGSGRVVRNNHTASKIIANPSATRSTIVAYTVRSRPGSPTATSATLDRVGNGSGGIVGGKCGRSPSDGRGTTPSCARQPSPPEAADRRAGRWGGSHGPRATALRCGCLHVRASPAGARSSPRTGGRPDAW